MEENSKAKSVLRALPSVDALRRACQVEGIGANRLTKLARDIISELRNELLARDDHPADKEFLLAEAAIRLHERIAHERRSSLQRGVINATGVVLHTNLGRAPLSAKAIEAVGSAARYCALEFDLEAGARGRRGARVEKLLAELTGAEAALVVNNCAAATLLVLTALARGGEAIISRGELVEIGGDFRIPDVMAQSGVTMIEVGTTNRTRLSDYERAINERTRLILRVHQSNYRIIGFTQTPTLDELATLAHARALPLYEDAGSGALVDLSPHGIKGEPIIGESIASGADVVSFSGDKLLGASQAGIIVGRRELIGIIGKHPLYRALRVDKLTFAALEATLEAYAHDAHFNEIPTLRMIAMRSETLKRRARSLAERIARSELHVEVIPGQSAVGGGAAPTAHLPTALLALRHERLSATEIERRLRLNDPPIIARIADDRVLLDLRTIAPEEENAVLAALEKL